MMQAASTFTGELNAYIENVRKVHEQIIDTINPDTLEFAGWNKDIKSCAEELIQDFKSYIESNKDKITALQIFYNQPYRRRDITYAMIKELSEKIKEDKPVLAPIRIWQAYPYNDI